MSLNRVAKWEFWVCRKGVITESFLGTSKSQRRAFRFHSWRVKQAVVHQDENKLHFCDTCSPSASSKHYSWLYLSIYPPIHLYIYLPACVQPSRKGHGCSSKEEGLGSNEQDPGSWPPKSSGERIPGDPQGQARSLQSQPGRWHVAKRPKTIYHTVNLRDRISEAWWVSICYLLNSQHPFIPLLTLYLPSALGKQTPLIPSCPHFFTSWNRSHP